MKRACDGDRAAFEMLVTRHYDSMFRFACKWCGNRDNAQDIAQDAAIKLARAIHSYDGRAAFTSWLYRVVINCAIDWQRAQGRHHHAGEAGMIGAAAPDDHEGSFYAKQVLAKLDSLPEKEKAALLLVCAEGMSHAEAAAALAVKESTVSWYIHEARKKLGVKDKKESRHG